jgi:recombination protein RecA
MVGLRMVANDLRLSPNERVLPAALRVPAALKVPGLIAASALEKRSEVPTSWSLAALAGRLVELSGLEAPAVLTLSVALVSDAQQAGEPVAWVTSEQSSFFPPDVAEHGIDLEALVVVRLGDAHAIPRAGVTLVRSGAFGLIVLDMGDNRTMPTPLEARLVKLSQQRKATVLCLTVKSPEDSSIGSMVSLRGTARRSDKATDSYTCEVHILKDKYRAPTWTHREEYRGPMGLC